MTSPSLGRLRPQPPFLLTRMVHSLSDFFLRLAGTTLQFKFTGQGGNPCVIPHGLHILDHTSPGRRRKDSARRKGM